MSSSDSGTFSLPGNNNENRKNNNNNSKSANRSVGNLSTSVTTKLLVKNMVEAAAATAGATALKEGGGKTQASNEQGRGGDGDLLYKEMMENVRDKFYLHRWIALSTVLSVFIPALG